MWIAVILLISTLSFAGELQTPIPLPEDSVKLVAARNAIFEIWRGVQVYYADRGEWPSEVKQLEDASYITLDSAVIIDWNFTFKGNPLETILAQQKYLAKNAKKDLGDFHRLWYNTWTGYWAGSGLPMYGVDTLTLEQQSLLVVEAQSSMFALSNASRAFYMDRGEEASVVKLVRNRYVLMPNSVKLNWNIRMYGTGPDSVVAISTDWMTNGPDHRLVYYPATQEFHGYGVVDPHYVPKLTPYLEYVEPKQKIK